MSQSVRPAPRRGPVLAGGDPRRHVGDMVVPTSSAAAAQPATSASAPSPVEPAETPAAPAAASVPYPTEMGINPSLPATGVSEVLDLPGGVDASAEMILGAILRHAEGGLVECPVRAPMCSEARLAVGRDRSVVLLAVARQGLAELRSIGQAYRWLIENRALVGMAIPQFAIDTHRMPRLRLIVDHVDASASVLQPILQSENVTVQAYRRLRWGERTGLLLEAA